MNLPRSVELNIMWLLIGCVMTSVFFMWLVPHYIKSRDQAVLEAVMDVASRPVELLPVPEGFGQ